MAPKVEKVKRITAEQFGEVVKEYKQANTQKKEAEKLTKKLNPTIKTYTLANSERASDNGSKFIDLDDSVIEVRPIWKNKSQDEMIAVLKKYGLKDCIKMVENVDEEALETAAIQGDVSEEQLKELQRKTESLYVK